MCAPALPAPLGTGSLRAGVSSASQPVDPVPGQAEERGHERDRRQDHDQHDRGDRHSCGRHGRDAGDREAENRDDHGPAGKDHGPAGGGDRAGRRLLDRQAVTEVPSVPGDEEQGVVDPYPEADHAREDRRPAGNVHEIGEEPHRADSDGDAEERDADRQAHGDDRAEREQEDDRRDEEADHLAGVRLPRLEGREEIAARLDLQC